MQKLIVVTLALGATLPPALSEQRYDRRLEAAAARIAAEKMGALRGGFGPHEKPQFTSAIDPAKPTHLSAERARPQPPAPPSKPKTSSFTSF